jgi:hypothetical protein
VGRGRDWRGGGGDWRGHTIFDLSTVGEPATEGDSRDLETRAAQETVLHLRQVLRGIGGSHFSRIG